MSGLGDGPPATSGPTGDASAATVKDAVTRVAPGRTHAAQGRLLVCAAATFWGTSATLARFVFHDRQVSPFVVVELRLVFAVVLLGLWRLATDPTSLIVRRADWGYVVVLALFGVATVQGSYYYTISRLGVGLAILLQYLAPALIVLWNLLRGRPVSTRTGASVVAAVIGTALLVGGVHVTATGARPIDWAVGFASAFFFAFYVVYSKRGLARYRPETMLFWTFALAALLWACVTPPWRIVAARYDASLWWMFLALGVFSTLVPFTLFYRGLERMPAAEAGVVATLEPLVALLSSWLVLGEALTGRQWLGAVLVLVAAGLAGAGEPGAAAVAERA